MSLPNFIKNPNPNIFLSDNYVVLDFETTNLNKGTATNPNNQIILAAWKCGPDHPSKIKTIKSKFANEFNLDDLITDCYLADFIIAQNAKFELQWLHRAGLQLEKVLPYDTILGQYVEDGNRRSPKDLDSLGSRYDIGNKLSIVSKLIKSGICPSEIPRGLLDKYCKSDVFITEQVFLRQRERLRELELLPVMFTRCIFTPVIADIELNGMHLDKDTVEDYYHEFNKCHANTLQALNDITGGINMKSPIQIAEFLYGDLGFKEITDKRGKPIRNKATKRFPDGQPKTDEATIGLLKPRNKRQREFLSLKKKISKLNKAIDTYLTPFYEIVQGDGIVYGNFNQAVTRTHRLSSSRPNFQNFDRNFKELFSARKKGWKIGERDASQLEFRVAAFLGGDDRAYTDIIEKVDIHSFTASILGTSRQAAKADTFKPLYGGQSGTERQQEYYRAFREKYHKIEGTQQGWIKEVLATKKLKTITGLTFYWPDTRVTHTGYVVNTASIYNYPVQSFATADIVPIATVYTWHQMKVMQFKAFIVNVIHDSIITEEPEDESEQLSQIAEEAFSIYVIDYLKKVYNIKFTVPLEIESKTGEFWNG